MISSGLLTEQSWEFPTRSVYVVFHQIDEINVTVDAWYIVTFLKMKFFAHARMTLSASRAIPALAVADEAPTATLRR